jgi:protein-tyrosine phosphatase
LEDEVQWWKQCGLHIAVSLLTDEEAADLDLENERQVCKAQGIEFRSFPIPDRGVPASMTAAARLVDDLKVALENGQHVGVHCRQGIGRSALVAACLLVLAGVDSETALQKTADAREADVPDTAEQREWIGAFASQMLASPARPASKG